MRGNVDHDQKKKDREKKWDLVKSCTLTFWFLRLSSLLTKNCKFRRSPNHPGFDNSLRGLTRLTKCYNYSSFQEKNVDQHLPKGETENEHARVSNMKLLPSSLGNPEDVTCLGLMCGHS